MTGASTMEHTVKYSETRTVLIVDDDEEIGCLMSWLVGDIGYRPIVAGNGREALDRAGEERPDLVLLDMNMPVMDGREFAREFQARYGTSVPIIVVTADDARRSAAEVGARAWIQKPFDVDRLVGSVKAHLNGSGHGSQGDGRGAGHGA